MARTTYTELMDTLEALQRATGVAPHRLGIAHANGRHCVVLDGGKRDVSPWLSLGELQDWLWAAIKGAHLLREDGETVITSFVLDDFDELTDEEREAVTTNEYQRRKLADTFLDGLNWHEVAGYAVDAWRIAYFTEASA